MDIQTIILGFLTARPMTGYALKKAFNISFSFFSGISYGSIYPALKKMQQADLIAMRLQVQENAPNRKIYSITEKGRAHFKAALKSPVAIGRFKSAFLARLFFFAHLDPAERVSVAQQYLEALQAEKDRLEEVQTEVASVADSFQMLCYRFGRQMMADLVRNVRQTVRALEKETNDHAGTD